VEHLHPDCRLALFDEQIPIRHLTHLLLLLPLVSPC
jgi:hypothetical protein